MGNGLGEGGAERDDLECVRIGSAAVVLSRPCTNHLGLFLEQTMWTLATVPLSVLYPWCM